MFVLYVVSYGVKRKQENQCFNITAINGGIPTIKGFLMKTYFILTVLLSSTFAIASPQDELLSAQQAFRQALTNQNTSHSKMQALQSQLADAQQRKMSADADFEKLTALFNEAQQQKQNHDALLQQAGERLNAAWQEARGTGQ